MKVAVVVLVGVKTVVSASGSVQWKWYSEPR